MVALANPSGFKELLSVVAVAAVATVGRRCCI